MFDMTQQIAPSQAEAILAAATAAARAIPPAFPLDATVAVNPFLGQTGEDLATAAARLGRVAGVSLTAPRAELVAKVTGGRDHRRRPGRSADPRDLGPQAARSGRAQGADAPVPPRRRYPPSPPWRPGPPAQTGR